jgi:3-oxoacyl-[acyl-carrier protein] reductase
VQEEELRMPDFKGRTALVTGASRGIGRAIALALAACGADVAVNYRTAAREAQDVVRGVTARGRAALTVRADVSRAADVAGMVAAVEKGLGPIDVLVNNAGIASYRTLEETTEADWDELLAVNLKSVFLVTQAVLPAMRRRKWGRIVNISSGAAQTGGIVGVHYTAAKAGIEGLTRAYAARLVKEGITVNAVAPALIETDMMASDDLEVRERRRRSIPLGRLGRAEEVAAAVVMAAGIEYMTGQTVHVNGGLYFR